MPRAPNTTWMPTSWSAIQGMVATMPVIATASASHRLPKRLRTKSPAVIIVMLVAHVPKPGEDQEWNRIDHDRVRHRKNAMAPRAKCERRNGNERVGGIKIAADQGLGDDCAEAAGS
jgi:hypothetical protein